MILLGQNKAKTIFKYLAMAICLAVSLGAWALASPVGSDPDGNFHLASIWCGNGYKLGQCEPPSEASKDIFPKIVTVPRAIALANGCMSEESASCSNKLNRDLEMVETGYNNAGRLYPNGYYWVSSHFVSNDVADSVTRIRFMNVFIYVLLIGAATAVLPKEVSKSLIFTHLIFLTPLGFFLVASNNPSSWAITGLGTYWAFLYGFFVKDDRRNVIACGFFAMVSGLMSIQSRADSAAFVVITSLIVTIISLTRHAELRTQIYRRLLLPAIFSVPAIISFVSASQSQAISSGLLGDQSYDRDPLTIFLWNITRLPGIFAGIFGFSGAGGGLGWLDTPMPEIVSLGMLFLVAYLLSQSRIKRSRIEVVSLLAFLGLICALPILILQQDGAVVGENFQSRYLLPSLIVLSGLYFSKSLILDNKLRTPKLLTTGLLVVAYVVSLHATMRRYVLGKGLRSWNLDRNQDWWWEGYLSPMSLLIFGSLTYAGLVIHCIYDKNQSTCVIER